MFFFFLEIKIFFKAMPKNWSKGKSKLRILWTAKNNFQYFDYREKIQFNSLDKFRTQDTVWTLLKTLCIQSRMGVPTWAACNSVIGKSNPLTLVSTLPIINGFLTEWDNLYNAIRMVNDLSTKLLPEQKTIIYFNLQLYAKAVLLQANPEILNNFVFRMGELHAVFCFLKVLGKMIDGSGWDQAFEEAHNLFEFFIQFFFGNFSFFLLLQPNLCSTKFKKQLHKRT